MLLFVINLIPIPPLDGFTVLGGFLTARQMYSLAPLQQWGPLIILILYFRAKGGYKAQVLTGHAAEDKEFTGGVEAGMEA